MPYLTAYKKKSNDLSMHPDGWCWRTYLTKSHTDMHQNLRDNHEGVTFEGPNPRVITNFCEGMFPLPKVVPLNKETKRVDTTE